MKPLAVAALLAVALALPAADKKDDGFQPLYNGKDLTGWKVNEGGKMDVWGADKDVLFVFLTSHGSPDGVVVGDTMISPNTMATMVSNSCGSRPTVVVISACFSGVFVPDLEAPNRIILTAARPDRTSFGCGQALRYTFFDECFLQSMQSGHDFPAVATEIKSCVAAREVKEKMSPPSEPQLYIGAQIAQNLPRLLAHDRGDATHGGGPSTGVRRGARLRVSGRRCR